VSFETQTFEPCDCAALAYRNGGKHMPHWRALVDSRFLNHAALDGKDCTVTIRAVSMAEVIGENGKKSKKAHLFFEGKEKPMLAGVTVLATIASMHGDDYLGWVGKRVTLYPTIIELAKGPTGAVRVRPVKPQPAKGGKQEPAEPGSNG
jgi:predicted transcriptional regulator